MSREWDYVSELRPVTGLLFILQMTYKSGEPLWDYWQEKPEKLSVPICPPHILTDHGLSVRPPSHRDFEYAAVFTDGVDVNIAYDVDKVRTAATQAEHVIPRDPDVHNMTIHLDNLFNGDRFLVKFG
jgi:hypothetical protein